jgi:hypothetical protein
MPHAFQLRYAVLHSVGIDRGTLVFRKNVSHPKIMQMVVESELNMR